MKIISILFICTALAVSGNALARAPKTPAAPPPPPPPTETQDNSPPLPSDLNQASLRVTALDTLYELDLSPDQLKILRSAANGAATTRPMTPARGNTKLHAALQELQAAILDGKDDERIATARNAVVDLVSTDEEVELHDDVQTTDAARTKAPDVVRGIKASQIAAYLAVHADQIADPVERMMGSLGDVREGGSDAKAEIEQVSDDVARMVAGLDDAKAKIVSDQITAFLKSAQDMTEDGFTAKQGELEESAKKIAGDVPPMEILNHWLENEIADLLANPQLRPAIDLMIAARTQTH